MQNMNKFPHQYTDSVAPVYHFYNGSVADGNYIVLRNLNNPF